MGYRLIADTAMVLHFAFLGYLLAGGFLAWRWRRTIWIHVAVAIWGAGSVLIGYDCPLTHVENWARERAGEVTLPPSGFIDHYLTGVVYPQQHETLVQLGVAVVVAISWAGYAVRARAAHADEER